jgi:hypothetical protein
MAKAGVSAKDILGGGLTGALDLAAAGQLSVGDAPRSRRRRVNQFNLQGKDVSHVADLYSAAAGKAQGSVQDIAGAMKYAGVTAASMGVSIEETTGTIGLFASKGIIGEQAGTSFRSMLMSLTAPSKARRGDDGRPRHQRLRRAATRSSSTTSACRWTSCRRGRRGSRRPSVAWRARSPASRSQPQPVP